ncbi:MAG TPA: hypothetical protein VFL85_01945 [Candidatus Saccharimonadales bacterium]|nr:hypothetical protein [Candidatus Saccharimonadales bacterium]
MARTNTSYRQQAIKQLALSSAATLGLMLACVTPAHAADTYLYSVSCTAHYGRLHATTKVYQRGSYHFAKVYADKYYKRWTHDKFKFDGGYVRDKDGVGYTTYQWRPSAKKHWIQSWWKDPSFLGADDQAHCSMGVY